MIHSCLSFYATADKKTVSTIRYMHSVFLLSHLNLIYVYVCIGSNKFTCLRYWIGSWYTEQEQCDFFRCYKSNLRYVITSPDFDSTDMLSILTHELKVRKKDVLPDVSFTPCRLSYPYFHVTRISLSPSSVSPGAVVLMW